jgi:hypothetical protein
LGFKKGMMRCNPTIGGEVGAKGVKWSVFGEIFLRDLEKKSKFQLSKNPPRRYTKTAPLYPFCPTLPPIPYIYKGIGFCFPLCITMVVDTKWEY